MKNRINTINGAALRNPVAKAYALREVRAQIAAIGAACMDAQDGSEQRELLANLAFMLGLGAEIAAAVPVNGDNRAGLHQALAEVIDMACSGCAWRADWAEQLCDAQEISGDLVADNARIASQLWAGACGLASDVEAGRIRPDAIEPFTWPDALAA